jgi:ferredoxin-NADP reductase
MIVKYIPDVKAPIYYIVGPPQMVDAMEQILLGLEVSADKIKLEKF